MRLRSLGSSTPVCFLPIQTLNRWISLVLHSKSISCTEELWIFFLLKTGTSSRNLTLLLNPVFLPCGNRGDLDYGCAVTVVDRLLGDM